jgi:hypothetical protein
VAAGGLYKAAFDEFYDASKYQAVVELEEAQRQVIMSALDALDDGAD